MRFLKMSTRLDILLSPSRLEKLTPLEENTRAHALRPERAEGADLPSPPSLSVTTALLVSDAP
jgi:hypothetical protein